MARPGNLQRSRTLQEKTTPLPASEVLGYAKVFFARRNGVYSAFPEQESARHVTLRGQGGEEVVVGTAPAEGGGTRVTASTYLFDQQVARYLDNLPPMPSPDPADPMSAPPEMPVSGVES